MASETFEAWLLIPGNHRIILKLKKQVSTITNQPAKIDSWRTLYEYFEVLSSMDMAYAQYFSSIFSSHPPSVESGATRTQIELFEHTC